MTIRITHESKKDFETFRILHTPFKGIDPKNYTTITMGYIYAPYIPLYLTGKKTKWVPF